MRSRRLTDRPGWWEIAPGTQVGVMSVALDLDVEPAELLAAIGLLAEALAATGLADVARTRGETPRDRRAGRSPGPVHGLV